MIHERLDMNARYANLMLFRLLELFYDSKGKGARFRTCILGKEDIVNHFKDEGLEFSEESWGENRDRCHDFLKQLGIIKDLTLNIKDNEAEIRIQSCIHIPMEEMLKREEVPPYTCIPANLLAYGIETATGKQTEISKIETGKDLCKINMLLFREDEARAG
ncbi:MAG: hypothetical protein JRJ31_21195 [Deltaproteobacteria bacterium]|nr:hypothetical protein [Deltaproteobacteria bacterium]